jgi:hypothetical protein
VSEQPHDTAGAPPAVTIEELARAQRAEAVSDAAKLAAEIWETDEELDAFLADLRASRNASTA